VQTKFLPENSNTGRYLARSASGFKSTDRLATVNVVWGLKEQDLSTCHRTDAQCFGETVWDDDFDINSENAQRQIKVGFL
jgi:hypothetical protein